LTMVGSESKSLALACSNYLQALYQYNVRITKRLHSNSRVPFLG
jgi:hypothetical protein